MKQTRLLMGMPITIEIVDKKAKDTTFDLIYSYFEYIDNKFSTYKDTSEITMINKKMLDQSQYSPDMKKVLKLCEDTKKQTDGFFSIEHDGKIDPSGLVKGWSIFNAATLLKNMGYKNFYLDAGGDIQVSGKNAQGRDWILGIQNPFNQKEIVKVLTVRDMGVATSGTYIRGQHVYNPKSNKKIDDIVSLTVVGPNIYDADRFATAAFAMGGHGIEFIKKLSGFEGYMIFKNSVALYTNGFERYVINDI